MWVNPMNGDVENNQDNRNTNPGHAQHTKSTESSIIQ